MSDLKTIIARWKDGARLSELAAELGWRRSKLRKELTRAVGGREKYRALRADGAGGQTELFGGKRSTGSIVPDDEKVPTIKNAKGWSVRWVGREVQREIFTTKDGAEYVRAGASERADLIVQLSKRIDHRVRLRKAENSSLIRKIRREQRRAKSNEAALQRQTTRRRERRVRRKLGRSHA